MLDIPSKEVLTFVHVTIHLINSIPMVARYMPKFYCLVSAFLATCFVMFFALTDGQKLVGGLEHQYYFPIQLGM